MTDLATLTPAALAEMTDAELADHDRDATEFEPECECAKAIKGEIARRRLAPAVVEADLPY